MSAQVPSPAGLLHQAVENEFTTWFNYADAERRLMDLITTYMESPDASDSPEERAKMMFFFRQMLYLIRAFYVYCPSTGGKQAAYKAVFDLRDECDAAAV